MELYDHETVAHSRRVTSMALKLARTLGIKEADAEAKAKAARIAMLASRTNTLLSLPMLLLGIWLWIVAHRLRTPSGNFVAAQ